MFEITFDDGLRSNLFKQSVLCPGSKAISLPVAKELAGDSDECFSFFKSVDGLLNTLGGCVRTGEIIEFNEVDFTAPGYHVSPLCRGQARIYFILCGSVEFRCTPTAVAKVFQAGNIIAFSGFCGYRMRRLSAAPALVLASDYVPSAPLDQMLRQFNLLQCGTKFPQISKRKVRLLDFNQPSYLPALEVNWQVIHPSLLELQIELVLKILGSFGFDVGSRFRRLQNSLLFFLAQWNRLYSMHQETKDGHLEYSHALSQLTDHIASFCADWQLPGGMSVFGLVNRAFLLSALAGDRGGENVLPNAVKSRVKQRRTELTALAQPVAEQEELMQADKRPSIFFKPMYADSHSDSFFPFSFSESLSDVLEEKSISVLVSTYQNGIVYCISSFEGQLSVAPVAFERPMGMDFERTVLAVGTKRTVEIFQAVDASWQGAEGQGFERVSMHQTGEIDIHEVKLNGDEVWFINTKSSCVCTFSRTAAGSEHWLLRWQPNFISNLAAEDRCHLNGFCFDGSKLAYATALGMQDTAGGWRANRAFGGVLIDAASDEIVSYGLSMPHSPRLLGTELWLLESGSGHLCLADRNTGNIDYVARLPGFPRGIDFHDQLAFIGLSKVRESSLFSGISITENAQQRQSGFSVVDTMSGNTIAWFYFESPVDEVFSVKLLPGRLVDSCDL